MPSPPQARRRRRLWIAAALVAALLAARAGLPAVIAHVAREQATASLGVPVEIDDVDLWLLLGGIALEGVRVGSPGGEGPPLLSLERLYARIAWLAPLSGEIRLRDIESDGLELAAERDAAGALVLPPGLASDAGEEPLEPPARDAEPGASWPLAIDRVALRRTALRWSAADAQDRPPLVDLQIGEVALGDVVYRDGQLGLGQFGLSEPRLRIHPDLTRRTTAAAPGEPAATSEPAAPVEANAQETPAAQGEAFPLRLAQLRVEGASFTVLGAEQELTVALSLDARNITTARSERFPLRFELTSERGGKLAIEGDLGLRPLQWTGQVRWQDLSLPALASLALAPEPGPLDWIRAGDTAGDLAVAFSLDETRPELARVSGTTELRGFELRDEESLTVAFDRLAVAIDQLALPRDREHAAPTVALASVELAAPRLHYALAPAASQPASSQPAAGSRESPPPRFSLEKLRVSDGRIELEDRGFEPPVKSELRRLELVADGVHWPEGDVRRLRVRAQSRPRGAFELTGSLAGRSGELRAVLDELGLEPFAPYAAHYVGYGIDSGSATLHSDLALRRGSVTSHNRLLLSDLRMSAQGVGVIPDPLGVPIDVALALLRDARDEIHLAVPIEVGEGGTRSGAGTAVTSALKQAILGALSTPLQMAGAIPLPIRVPGLQRDDSAARAFAFAPGSSDPEPGSVRLAQALAKLLADRPALALRLHGASDDEDARVLSRRSLLAHLEADDAPDLPDSGFLQRRRLRQGLERQLAGEPDELESDDRRALERWVALVPVADSELAFLARQRAEAVRALIDADAELGADRIALGATERGRREVRSTLGSYPDAAESSGAGGAS